MIYLFESPNLRRANFDVMRRTYRTLNDYEMQHNEEVGLFTGPSRFIADDIWLIADTFSNHSCPALGKEKR